MCLWHRLIVEESDDGLKEMWKTVGHRRAIDLLSGSLSRGMVAHAYLFAGPAHVGKMTLARDLACALNCTGSAVESRSGDSPVKATGPCGECAACQRIAAGKHADVQEIRLGRNAEGKSLTEIGIDDIRHLQHSANLPPFEGRCKVFIIDGAELLSTEAANCLLKTLEEPMDRVVFILLTVNEQLVLPTVASRCQKVELSPLPATEIEAALIERWSVPPDRSRLLARLSHGRLGWAVEAGDEQLQRRAELLDELIALADANFEDRFDVAARLATEFGQDRAKVEEKLSLWLDWWHDLLLVKTGLEADVTNIDRLDELELRAAGLDLTEIRNVIESIRTTGDYLKLNANARLCLEALMLDLPAREVENEGKGQVAQGRSSSRGEQR